LSPRDLSLSQSENVDFSSEQEDKENTEEDEWAYEDEEDSADEENESDAFTNTFEKGVNGLGDVNHAASLKGKEEEWRYEDEEDKVNLNGIQSVSGGGMDKNVGLFVGASGLLFILLILFWVVMLKRKKRVGKKIREMEEEMELGKVVNVDDYLPNCISKKGLVAMGVIVKGEYIGIDERQVLNEKKEKVKGLTFEYKEGEEEEGEEEGEEEEREEEREEEKDKIKYPMLHAIGH
jgi:hypothetical protein